MSARSKGSIYRKLSSVYHFNIQITPSWGAEGWAQVKQKERKNDSLIA